MELRQKWVVQNWVDQRSASTLFPPEVALFLPQLLPLIPFNLHVASNLAIFSIVFREHYYIFGGEFCTSDKFHHHRDMWRLNTSTMCWEEIKAKGGPSARSGHRMTLWRNNIILFGGFYEAFRETQWWNDLYIFSIPTLTWRKIEFPPMAPLPGVRSGHQLLVHGDTLIVNGGYTKLKRSKKTESKVIILM